MHARMYMYDRHVNKWTCMRLARDLHVTCTRLARDLHATCTVTCTLICDLLPALLPPDESPPLTHPVPPACTPSLDRLEFAHLLPNL